MGVFRFEREDFSGEGLFLVLLFYGFCLFFVFKCWFFRIERICYNGIVVRVWTGSDCGLYRFFCDYGFGVFIVGYIYVIYFGIYLRLRVWEVCV